MDLNRLINRLNPGAPLGAIDHVSAWLEEWNARHCEAGSTVATQQIVSPGEGRQTDFLRVKPATDEDYLLRVDVEKSRHINVKPRQLFSIPWGRVLGPEGCIVSPDNRILSELTFGLADARSQTVFRRRRFPALERLQGTYLSLVYPDSANYYHWLLESLPNLRCVKKSIPGLTGIFVPPLKSFHRDSLACFGIGPERLIELTPKKYFSCERLLATSFSSAWALHEWVPGWLKSHLLECVGSSTPRKVYISRRDGSWRRVANETEVVRLLRSAGYEVIELASIDIREQAQLFDSAVSVISVHGAGLTNLAFCKPGTRVLEIFPLRWTSLCYLQLAVLVGCQYSHITAAPLGRLREEIDKDIQHVPHDAEKQGADIEIPLDKLERYLQWESAQGGAST